MMCLSLCLSHCRLPFCDNTHTLFHFRLLNVFTVMCTLTNANCWLLNSQRRTHQRYSDQKKSSARKRHVRLWPKADISCPSRASRKTGAGASRTNPPHVAWAVQGGPNLGIALNATNDERRHRWGREVGYARANKIVENPSRSKFRQCLLAANGISTIHQP